VRTAQAGDEQVFLDLVRALAEYEKLDPPCHKAQARLIADGFGEPRRFEPWIAEVDGRPVGYAITFRTYSSFLARPTFYLEDLFVLPEERRGGVGREIFRRLAQQAAAEGCGRMEWQCLNWNEPGLQFYRRLGASRMDEWVWHRLDADGLAAVASE
jgi:GNAT superfamily N-acetyltransferase